MPTQSDDIINIRTSQTFRGLGGADEFRWHSGNARIYGGDTGEDYDSDYYGEKTGGDRLYIMRNTDTRVTFKSTEDGTAKTDGDKLSFFGIERLHLGNGDDVINATGASVDRWGLSIYANGGNDKIVGSRAKDFIDPGAGNDVVKAGARADFIQGSPGDDVVYGGAGNDNIRWGWGDPYVPPGNDRLHGGDGGWDLVNVWIKYEWLNSEGVEVKIKSVASDGSMKGSSFTDMGGPRSTLKFEGFEQGWTHEGKDFVNGANAQIQGSKGMQWNTRWGDDVVIGTRGNDTIEGGAGRDRITAGKGNDLIVADVNYWYPNTEGDRDRDVLIFRKGDGHDTVYAFDFDKDRIDVGGREYDIRESNNWTWVELDDGDSIRIRGVSNHDLLIS